MSGPSRGIWDRIRCGLGICAGILTVVGVPAWGQDCGDLFDADQVLDFHVTMDPADWEALRFSCPAGYCGPRPHDYFSATFRCEDGPEIDIGIRRKNGQAEPSEADPQKPSLKIDINEFVTNQTFFGKTKIDLENGSGSAGQGGGGSNDNGIREGIAWLFYNDAAVVASRASWVNVWVNGDYKGLYTNVEQVDKAYLVDHGIDDGGWLFKGPGNDQRTREGEPNPFAFNWYPFDHQNNPDPQPPDWQTQTEVRVDMLQLLTLAAVTNFVANKDAVVFKNNNYWYYDWTVFPGGQQPRLYLGWDLDTVLREDDYPILGVPHPNGHMAQGLLRDDPVFQAQYYQIYNDLLAGPLSPAATLARIDALEPVLTQHIQADPYQTAGDAADMFQEVRDFLGLRSAFVVAQLGACPNAVCEAAETSCTCPSDCGSPPPVETDCTNLTDDDCDEAIDCSDSDCTDDPACAVQPPTNTIVVNEIVANSDESPDVEYVEILNEGPGAQDLTGWYILDDDDLHDRCYLDATLQPGEYLVVAGFIDDFAAKYPEAIANLNPNPFDSDTGGQGFGLGDDNDQIRLFRPTAQGDEFVAGFTFGPQAEEIPFAFLPEGSDAPEYVTFPTPAGVNDIVEVHSSICINEFLTTSQSGGVDDWVELYNRGDAIVDIGGWYLSDNAARPTRYAFPPGSSIPPGGFLTVDETQLGFGFSSTGSEVIVLTHSDGETGQDYFDYEVQFPDVTRGRFPDGAPYWKFFSSTSRGFANGCRVSNLVFSSASDLAWDPLGEATTYDVVRGDLGQLRATGGDFSSSVSDCLADETNGSTWVDAESPPVSEGRFYLVRATDTPCGVGTYDASSTAQISSRDASIQLAEQACP